MTPLNPVLYDRLQQIFGSVEIAKQGEAHQSTYYREGLYERAQQISSGEYYRVNCPYCGHVRRGAADTRKRLWICHVWGVPDDRNNNRWSQAHCFNENCLSREEFRKDLQARVYRDMEFARRRELRVLPGRIAPPPGKVSWPGDCVTLAGMDALHPAVQYLNSRGFDHEQLAAMYDVRYCVRPPSEYAAAAGRIIAPIMKHGEMVSWQARYVGEGDWKRVSKYYNLPNSGKAQLLYNYDQAKQFPFTVLVEGFTDVWRIGDCAVASMGKSLSDAQSRMLSQWKALLIALDGDARDKSAEILYRLSNLTRVIDVPLPPDADPGGMSRDAFWDIAYRAATNAGVNLLQL